jgi:hypothetical protein
MSNGTDKEKLIEFKAEVKLDLKYIRKAAEEIKKKQEEQSKKINSQCTEIAIIKTKVAIYAAIASFIISPITAIIVALIISAIKG